MAVVVSGCGNSSTKQLKVGRGKIKFEKTSHNFGNLKHGDVVGYRFKFYNKGLDPVTIQKIDKSCGCTDVIYPKKPVASQDSAFIEVVFDSKGRHGRQLKRVVITANNDSIRSHELLIWADIKK